MKKLLALIFALVMALAPVSAFAEDAEQTTYYVSVYTGTVTDEPSPAYQIEVTGDEGMTGTEVLKTAFEKEEIPYVIESTEYGNYLSSVDGLSELDHGKLSGWMCAIDHDGFSNMGIDTVLSPEAELEVHYSVTGGEDIGATWGSLPILTNLKFDGISVAMTKETDYTTYTTTYRADGKELVGSGSEADPFLLSFTLPYGTDVENIDFSWESSLHPCYGELLLDTADFSNPVALMLTCATTDTETHYLVSVSVEALRYSGGCGGGGISRAPEKEKLDLAPYLDDLSVSGFGSEWATLALARGGAEHSQGVLDAYFTDVVEKLKETNGVLSERKYTEYSRTVLALAALGVNPKQVAGYDLTAPLFEKEAVLKQGINGAIWARLALKTVGEDAYLEEILSAQNPDGGWSLSGDTSDPDLTAMALVSLRDSGATEALKSGLAFLQGVTPNTCETAAQILLATIALGAEGDTEALLAFRTKDGFSHEKGGETNQMSTEQAVLALTAVFRAEHNLPFVYDMSDAKRIVSIFYDVTEHANKTAIESLSERGFVTGFPDGSFVPDGEMTRAEFCALLTRALNLTGGETTLSDVRTSDWYYNAVCAAVGAGIVKGRTNGKFDPSSNITVTEANLMVSRAAEYLGLSWETEQGERAILRGELAQMMFDLLEMADA